MRLSSLVVFPIKSCGPVSLERARVERRGLEHDRRFMIVDEAGRFVTQREEPRLSRVKVTIDADAMRVEARGHELDPELGVVETALDPERGELVGAHRVTVWQSTVEVPEVPRLSAFFVRLLGRSVRCVAMTRATHRAISERHARPGDEVSFADGYPLLLASESSRRDLEARAGVPLVMARFRPNVAIEGAPAWDEDGWTHVRIGSVLFRAPKPCARCVMTTIDPETGRADKEPLKTLATFRKVEGEVMFGVNLVPVLADGQEGSLSIGDSVTPSA